MLQLPKSHQEIAHAYDKTASEQRVCNLYSYAGNDPVNFTDPSGMKMIMDCNRTLAGCGTGGGTDWTFGGAAGTIADPTYGLINSDLGTTAFVGTPGQTTLGAHADL